MSFLRVKWCKEHVNCGHTVRWVILHSVFEPMWCTQNKCPVQKENIPIINSKHDGPYMCQRSLNSWQCLHLRLSWLVAEWFNMPKHKNHLIWLARLICLRLKNELGLIRPYSLLPLCVQCVQYSCWNMTWFHCVVIWLNTNQFRNMNWFWHRTTWSGKKKKKNN